MGAVEPWIVVNGSPEFETRVRSALALLKVTRTGAELMELIRKSGHTVTIEPTGDGNGYCRPAKPQDAEPGGPGCPSTIAWNPDHETVGPGDRTGSMVVLGTLLVHACHHARASNPGTLKYVYGGQAGAASVGRDRLAAGLEGSFVVSPEGGLVRVPDYGDSFPSENSIRADTGLPKRKNFFPSNWPGGPPW